MQIKSVTLPYDKRHKFNFLIDTTMTQKEKLYFEYLEIQNSIYAVKGETDKQINLDEFCKTGKFWVTAKNSKVFELQQDIENAKKRLADAQLEQRKQAWFATDEGSQWKAAKEAEIKSLYDKELALLNEAHKHASSVVKQLLGAHFDVTSFGSRNMTIGLIKEYKEDGRAEAYFGHTFDVYYERDYFNGNKARWELNYGTLGAFDCATTCASLLTSLQSCQIAATM